MSVRYWLSTLLSPTIAPSRWLQWIKKFNGIENLFHADLQALKAAGLPDKVIQLIQIPNEIILQRHLTWSEQAYHHIVSFTDEHYPRLLKEINDPPLVLFVRGDLQALHTQQIAMVGARNASHNGEANALQFAYCLAQQGFTITSGLALGIDAASHRGALRAHGLTVAVLGTGLNCLYPKQHAGLYAEIIAANGAVVSEFLLDTPPAAYHFPRRNRIISGLSLGVLIVEAALKSGSLITARHALEQGREVFAIPGSIHHPLARGCHHLIRQGAKLVETAQDILEELNCPHPVVVKKKEGQPKSSHLHLLDFIDYAVTSTDMLILQTGLTVGELSSMLLSLELAGYIQAVDGGYIKVVQQN